VTDGTVMVENAKIIFRNFSGRETEFNSQGDRNFCVILDEATAQMLVEDGWNIRRTKPRGEDEATDPYIQVSVSFKIKPPLITMITSGGRTVLNEDTVENLDWVDVRKVDLIFQPYNWTLKSGRSGIKAYLKTMFIEIEEDALEIKYREMEDLPSRSGRVSE